MVRLANRLPVVAIPEQRLVAPVRRAVIDDGCRLYLPSGRASNTNRMHGQERCPSLLPLRPVSSRCRRSTPCVMLPVAMDALLSLWTASGRYVHRWADRHMHSPLSFYRLPPVARGTMRSGTVATLLMPRSAQCRHRGSAARRLNRCSTPTLPRSLRTVMRTNQSSKCHAHAKPLLKQTDSNC